MLGTSRQLAVGPEALVSILTGTTIRNYIKTNPDANVVGVATSLSLLVGLFTLLLGVLRLGFLDCVISRALLRGFITAVAVVVCVEMTPSLLRINLDSTTAQSPVETAMEIVSKLGTLHPLTLVISCASITFLQLMRAVKRG